MSDHTWDENDDSPDDLDDERSGLDAFGIDEISGGTKGDLPPATIGDDDSTGPLTFGVTNPAGTITAQATISGAIRRIELSTSVNSMTEFDLARDIMATAKLANLQGRTVQRGMIQGLLMHQGLEADIAEQLIDDIVDLPTPAQFEAAQAAAEAEYLRNANTDRW